MTSGSELGRCCAVRLRAAAQLLKRTAAALVLAAALLAAQAGAAPADELFTLLAQRQHGRVRFVEEHSIAMLDAPLESSGELRYDAPDRLEKRIERPRPEVLVLERGTLRVQRGRHSYVLPLGKQPAALALVDSVRALLAGDRAALERHFRIEFSGSLRGWTLTLTPGDTDAARAVRRIIVTGSGDTVHEIDTVQSDGDRTRLILGPELPP